MMPLDILLSSNLNTPWNVCITALTFAVIYYILKNRGLPPGPFGLPYIGYWPFLKTATCHLQLQELGKKYGEVYSFRTTGKLLVNLCSFRANKEAFITKSECFSDRLKDYNIATVLFRGSVLFLNGESWKVNRKFFSQQFRERGMSSIKGESCGPIYDAIKETLEVLRQKNGEPLDFISLLTDKCTTVLFRTCFGENGISSQEIRELNENYAKMTENITGPNLLLSGTVAKYFIMPLMPSFRSMHKYATIMENMLYDIIKRHRSTFNEDNIRNLIDAYLMEEKVRKSKNDPTAQYFTDHILAGSLIQFIGDGVLAVAIFISAFCDTLLEHPEEEEKIYKELMYGVGTERDPIIEDKNQLPYTNAFILEMMRMSNSFPFFAKAECTKETTIKGYRIPKGAVMIMNSWASHFDPEVFEEPEKFNPSRYLQKEGQKKAELPILFGLGKRSCLGEGFTMAQVFLFLTTIVKHFRLSTPVKSKDDEFLFFTAKMIMSAKPRNE
ncbi:cytochrome P450 2C70 [Parasteatoda tepidariorum]|uniref:cytochrome P450 2C70 n=1 Tax=Parasteatoda tepidariorum TaxID=114398 RepID=UPI001C71D591|nr:cytochrome P450 2C70 [Parasteatoda tepidariorum]XP_015906742.2 cytochrome P450 2C70 [Parasteatoda tepidariorum]XP_042902285.1 cytochrome P450 2C70 [Parasteatoda tepidariorum]